MHKMIKPLYLVLLLLIAKVSADCQLSANNIQTTNRIFAYRSGSKLYLLRTVVVPTGLELELICNGADVEKVTCKEDGKFKPNFPTANRQCTNPISESVQRFGHPSCIHTMFLVGYHFVNQNENQFLELYRSCYDESIKRPDFSVHHLYHFSLKNGLREDNWDKYPVIDGVIERTFKTSSAYARLNQLLGPSQTYISQQDRRAFDRGHLAPYNDFAFKRYSMATSKYINAVPQFCKDNSCVWRLLEAWVRKKLETDVVADGNKYKTYQICTGGLGVLKLLDANRAQQEIYLYGGDLSHPDPTYHKPLNPVPEWIYKVVSHGRNVLYTFISYNNIDRSVTPTLICPTVQCPIDSLFERNIFCCKSPDFLNSYATHCSPHLHEDQVPR